MDFLDDNKKMLLALLSSAIRGKAFQAETFVNIDWQAIFDEAVKHQVLPLVYPLLSGMDKSMGIPKGLLECWRTDTLHACMAQEHNYFLIGNILKSFSNAGIPVIVLKGLVLRDLYPDPGLRSMGDADLLIMPGDMERAGGILRNFQYVLCSDDGKHAEYTHKHFLSIELHRAIMPYDCVDKYTDFESGIWERSVQANVGGVQAFSLSARDMAVYLLMHMSSHAISGGFGLRQLSDFVLFVEAHSKDMDWNGFFKTAQWCHIETFAKILLEVCRKLLALALPEACRESGPQDSSLVNDLILDIFDGGVFGKSSNERISANRLIHYNNGKEANRLIQKLEGNIRLLFPKASKMDIKYRYAERNRLLLPIAWIHRIIYTFMQSGLDSFKNKTVITQARIEVYNNRAILLRRLGLLD